MSPFLFDRLPSRLFIECQLFIPPSLLRRRALIHILLPVTI
jgi:hypothetical protein